MIGARIGKVDVKGPTRTGIVGVEADGGAARLAQKRVDCILKQGQGCGGGIGQRQFGADLVAQFQGEGAAKIGLGAQEQQALTLGLGLADIQQRNRRADRIAQRQREARPGVRVQPIRIHRQDQLLFRRCSGFLGGHLLRAAGRRRGRGGAFGLAERDVKAHPLKHLHRTVEDGGIGGVLQLGRGDVTERKIGKGVIDRRFGIDKTAEHRRQHRVIDRGKIDDQMPRLAGRDERPAQGRDQRPKRQLLRQVIAQQREAERRVGQVQLAGNDADRSQQTVGKRLRRRHVQRHRSVPIVGRAGGDLVGIPDLCIQIDRRQLHRHRGQRGVKQRRVAGIENDGIDRPRIVQDQRLPEQCELDVKGGQIETCGQFPGKGRIVLIGGVDVKAEIQIGQEHLGPGSPLRQCGHEFKEARVVPAEGDGKAIIDLGPVVHDRAKFLAELVAGQRQVRQDELEHQRRQRQTKIARRPQPDGEAGVGLDQACRNHALLRDEIKDRQVVPTGLDLQAEGVGFVPQRHAGKDELLRALRQGGIQKAQRLAHETFGGRDLEPVAGVGKIGVRQGQRAIHAHEAIDPPNGAAGLVAVLDKDMIAKGNRGFTLIAVVIDLDIFRPGLAGIRRNRKHRARGQYLGRIRGRHRQAPPGQHGADRRQQPRAGIRRHKVGGQHDRGRRPRRPRSGFVAHLGGDGGRHVRGDGQIAPHHQRRIGHKRRDGCRVGVADVGAQQRIHRSGKDVRRRPADGVEGQRDPHRRARARGRLTGSVHRRDGRVIQRRDRQIPAHHHVGLQ